MNLENYSKKFTVDKAMNRHRDLIYQIMDMARQDRMNGKQYKMWCGRTKHLSHGEIQELILKSKREGKKPIALFSFLIKQRYALQKQERTNNRVAQERNLQEESQRFLTPTKETTSLGNR